MRAVPSSAASDATSTDKGEVVYVRRHNPYSTDAYAQVGYALAHPDPFAEEAVPEAYTKPSDSAAADDVKPARLMVGQVHFKASAEGLRGLLAAQCGAQVLAASNVKPKGHRGRLQGGLWNVTVRERDVAPLLRAVHKRPVFVTPTMCATSEAATVAKIPYDGGLEMGEPTWRVKGAAKAPKAVQVERPKKDLPEFIGAAAAAASAVPEAGEPAAAPQQ